MKKILTILISLCQIALVALLYVVICYFGSLVDLLINGSVNLAIYSPVYFVAAVFSVLVLVISVAVCGIMLFLIADKLIPAWIESTKKIVDKVITW